MLLHAVLPGSVSCCCVWWSRFCCAGLQTVSPCVCHTLCSAQSSRAQCCYKLATATALYMATPDSPAQRKPHHRQGSVLRGPAGRHRPGASIGTAAATAPTLSPPAQVVRKDSLLGWMLRKTLAGRQDRRHSTAQHDTMQHASLPSWPRGDADTHTKRRRSLGSRALREVGDTKHEAGPLCAGTVTLQTTFNAKCTRSTSCRHGSLHDALRSHTPISPRPKSGTRATNSPPQNLLAPVGWGAPDQQSTQPLHCHSACDPLPGLWTKRTWQSAVTLLTTTSPTTALSTAHLGQRRWGPAAFAS